MVPQDFLFILAILANAAHLWRLPVSLVIGCGQDVHSLYPIHVGEEQPAYFCVYIWLTNDRKVSSKPEHSMIKLQLGSGEDDLHGDQLSEEQIETVDKDEKWIDWVMHVWKRNDILDN